MTKFCRRVRANMHATRPIYSTFLESISLIMC